MSKRDNGLVCLLAGESKRLVGWVPEYRDWDACCVSCGYTRSVYTNKQKQDTTICYNTIEGNQCPGSLVYVKRASDLELEEVVREVVTSLAHLTPQALNCRGGCKGPSGKQLTIVGVKVKNRLATLHLGCEFDRIENMVKTTILECFEER